MSRSFDPSSPLPSEAEDAIPSKLADGLAELHSSPRVPVSVDSAILNAARAHFAGQAIKARSAGASRHSRLLRWVGAGAAAVAAVAAVLFIVHRPGTGPSIPRTALAGDVNGDGRVDILDAYLVARALADKAHAAALPAPWDVNHDGVVDQKDVDWIANAAVHVGSGGAVAIDSKLAGSADVFQMADDLKSLDASDGRPRMALALPSRGNYPKADGLSRHRERSEGPLPLGKEEILRRGQDDKHLRACYPPKGGTRPDASKGAAVQ